MRKISRDYSFTERELQALALMFAIGRSDWLTDEVRDILSQYLEGKLFYKTTVQPLVHRKRVLGTFPSDVGRFLLDMRSHPKQRTCSERSRTDG